ncbi:MAG: hypothetical protein P1U32_06585 [Legionellaceae bacterium]|nr:hypothetical protein [Legionellaceae bacterium]
MLSVFHEAELTPKEVNAFLNTNAQNVVVEIPPPMKRAIKTHLVQYIGTLISPSYTASDIPKGWSDIQLIRNTRHVRDYQGMMILAEESEAFHADYMAFVTQHKTAIRNSVTDKNFFIGFVHVSMLYKEIGLLNKMATGQMHPTNNRRTKLGDVCQELRETLQILEAHHHEGVAEKQFFLLTLMALGLHALASVHYVEGNFDYYNLDLSKHLLMQVLSLCQEGEEAMRQIEDPAIFDMYTLKGLFSSKLPYKDYQEQRDAILNLDIWTPEEREQMTGPRSRP